MPARSLRAAPFPSVPRLRGNPSAHPSHLHSWVQAALPSVASDARDTLTRREHSVHLIAIDLPGPSPGLTSCLHSLRPARMNIPPREGATRLRGGAWIAHTPGPDIRTLSYLHHSQSVMSPSVAVRFFSGKRGCTYACARMRTPRVAYLSAILTA